MSDQASSQPAMYVPISREPVRHLQDEIMLAVPLTLVRSMWRRFDVFEGLVLFGALWAGVAVIGNLVHGDGWDSVLFLTLVAVLLVLGAGQRRAKRLGLPQRFQRLRGFERDHPLALTFVGSIILGLLFTVT